MDVAVLFSSISFVYRRLFLPFPVNLKQLRNRALMNLIYLSNLCILHMIRGKVTFACYRRILHSWQKFLVRVCFSIRRSYIAVNVSERTFCTKIRRNLPKESRYQWRICGCSKFDRVSVTVELHLRRTCLDQTICTIAARRIATRPSSSLPAKRDFLPFKNVHHSVVC